jgi:hypothetical protein
VVGAEGTRVGKNFHMVASTRFSSARWGKEMEGRARGGGCAWRVIEGGVGVRPMSNERARRRRHPFGETGDQRVRVEDKACMGLLALGY